MSPIPQPKINSLMQQKAALVAEFICTSQLDLVTCKRLENEFTELAKVREFEAECYIALATLCALKRKYEEALGYFANIRQLGLWNYATSLYFAACSIYCGNIVAAAKEIRDLPIEGSPDYLRQLRALCVRVGLFQMAVQCTAKLVALGVDEDDEGAQLGQEAAITAEVIADSGINPQEVIERIHVAHTVVAQGCRDPIVAYGMTATFDGTLYKFPLHLSANELSALEYKIDETLFDSFETYTPGVIFFTCTPARPTYFPKTKEV